MTSAKQFFCERKNDFETRLFDLLEKELEADRRASSSENEPENKADDDFFGSLFEDKRFFWGLKLINRVI